MVTRRNRNRHTGVFLIGTFTPDALLVVLLFAPYDTASISMLMAPFSSARDIELEVLKHRMLDHHLYILAPSEVRLPGSGQVDVADGFVLRFAGSPGDGWKGGVGFLSPPAGCSCVKSCWLHIQGLDKWAP